MPKLKSGSVKKKPISVKIESSLDERIKRIRTIARERGERFNISEEIESFLEKRVKALEKEFSVENKTGTSEEQIKLI